MFETAAQGDRVSLLTHSEEMTCFLVAMELTRLNARLPLKITSENCILHGSLPQLHRTRSFTHYSLHRPVTRVLEYPTITTFCNATPCSKIRLCLKESNFAEGVSVSLRVLYSELLDNERGARRVEGAFGRVARTGELSSERNCLQLQVVVESETPAGGAGGARTRVVGAVVVGPVARTGPGRFFP